jgi:hypothetical protein
MSNTPTSAELGWFELGDSEPGFMIELPPPGAGSWRGGNGRTTGAVTDDGILDASGATDALVGG